jgi:hypothetical protein
MKRCYHGVREPKRTSPHGGILDIDERTGRAVARIIGGRHSTIAADELEPVSDLDGRQVLGQGSASHGLKMCKTPRRHIFKYAKEILGTHDARLSPPPSDAGECVFYRDAKQICQSLRVVVQQRFPRKFAIALLGLTELLVRNREVNLSPVAGSVKNRRVLTPPAVTVLGIVRLRDPPGTRWQLRRHLVFRPRRRSRPHIAPALESGRHAVSNAFAVACTCEH